MEIAALLKAPGLQTSRASGEGYGTDKGHRMNKCLPYEISQVRKIETNPFHIAAGIWLTAHLRRAEMQREFVQGLCGDSQKEAIDIYDHIEGGLFGVHSTVGDLIRVHFLLICQDMS